VVDDPAGTVTDAGTIATATLLLASETVVPPEGAAVLRVTIPCSLLPAARLAALSETPDMDVVALDGEVEELPHCTVLKRAATAATSLNEGGTHQVMCLMPAEASTTMPRAVPYGNAVKSTRTAATVQSDTSGLVAHSTPYASGYHHLFERSGSMAIQSAAPAFGSMDERLRPTDIAAWILCGLAILFGAWALHIGWQHSILDLHQWRQSHTALSAYEMTRGGPFWRYVTPILGPPWPSPIEMPLYQWIVATTSAAASLDLHATGRGVSVAFFIATLISAWFALDILDVRPRYRPIFIALTLVSPLYLFWSRTFMIESTALFFAVTYVLTIDRATKPRTTPSEQRIWMIAALATGVLASAVKVTTFVPWWTGGAMLVAARLHRTRPAPATIAAIATALVVPVLTAAGWLAFSGAVKSENLLSARLAWSTVAWQHFGPLSMRLSPRSWYAVPAGAVLGRTRHTVIASLPAFAGAWMAIGAYRTRLVPALLCVVLYFLPIAIFMHLYTAHVYYPYANSLLLIVMVGCGIVALLERRGVASWLGLGLLSVALFSAATSYLSGYYVDQQSDDRSRWPLATALRRRVPADDVLLIYGLDLNTEFPYTAGHWAIMSWENRGAGDPLFERTVARLAPEHRRVGALVACGESRTDPIVATTARWLEFDGRPFDRDSYCDVYFPRDRAPATPITFR
jgi:hypothetical protein